MTPNLKSRHLRASHREHGFSLVEVLIALIIMSVGMLGIASLYVQSMQAGRTSMFYHQAVTLAGDVADRIRANPLARDAYEGAGGAQGCVSTGNCDEDEMAANDIAVWTDQATTSLPSGQVTIAFADLEPPEYTITVDWDEPGDNDPSYEIKIPVLDQ